MSQQLTGNSKAFLNCQVKGYALCGYGTTLTTTGHFGGTVITHTHAPTNLINREKGFINYLLDIKYKIETYI